MTIGIGPKPTVESGCPVAMQIVPMVSTRQMPIRLPRSHPNKIPLPMAKTPVAIDLSFKRAANVDSQRIRRQGRSSIDCRRHGHILVASGGPAPLVLVAVAEVPRFVFLAGGAAAVVLRQDPLAQPDGLGGHFHELVAADEFDG